MGHPDSGRIQAFIDGEVDQTDTAEIQAHLDRCGECRNQEVALRASSLATARALELLDTRPPIREAKARFLQMQRSGPGSFWRLRFP